jgi:uncharacterized protein with PIN domain
MPCPLCQSQNIAFYYQDKKADYLRCSQCELVFVAHEYVGPGPEPKSKPFAPFLRCVVTGSNTWDKNAWYALSWGLFWCLS